jgi:hypothetical protein
VRCSELKSYNISIYDNIIIFYYGNMCPIYYYVGDLYDVYTHIMRTAKTALYIIFKREYSVHSPLLLCTNHVRKGGNRRTDFGVVKTV